MMMVLSTRPYADAVAFLRSLEESSFVTRSRAWLTGATFSASISALRKVRPQVHLPIARSLSSDAFVTCFSSSNVFCWSASDFSVVAHCDRCIGTHAWQMETPQQGVVIGVDNR